MVDVQTFSQIRDGIRSELQRSTRISRHFISAARREGQVWVLSIDPDKSRDPLKETLEGATAYWDAPENSRAEVLSILAETSEIVIRYASSEPPQAGELRLAPIPFLRPLLDFYSDDAQARECFAWLDRTNSSNRSNPGRRLFTRSFGRLRSAQVDAFALARWERAFLWGPPGTGKTYTVGRMIAQHLVQFPNDRILFLSMTNSAVDLGVVAADEGVGDLAPSQRTALRSQMYRVGNRFIASRYDGREYLLPHPDEQALARLVNLEAQEPEKENIAAYAEWRAQVEHLREELRTSTLQVLANSRLAGITSTLCLMNYDAIRMLPRFDWIVVDEASQVGLVVALALAQLGERILFAGDPRQLAPIVQSEHPEAIRWLGKSIFDEMDEEHESTTMLDEQSRMAAPICAAVSNIFYDGRLRVSEDALQSQDWQSARRPLPIRDQPQHAFIERIDEKSTWSRKYNGPIRWASVQRITELLRMITSTWVSQQDVLVVTPFNAQRFLIRQQLRGIGLRQVAVSTVHRAQGGERHTVLFDPVDGASEFFQKRFDSRRLINVAISRAQAQLVLLLSTEDRRNPLLDALANILEPPMRVADAEPISDFAIRPDFPTCTLGRTIYFSPKITGLVEELVENNRTLVVRDMASGLHRRFSAQELIKIHSPF